jgi:hypothetical protein
MCFDGPVAERLLDEVERSGHLRDDAVLVDDQTRNALSRQNSLDTCSDVWSVQASALSTLA